MTRRVVITGMGWITPLGHDVATVWPRLLAGESAVGRVTRFDASTFATNFAAEVRGFRLADHLPTHARHAGAGLNSQFALAAARQAWVQAGLDKAAAARGVDLDRMGMYLGAGEGSLEYDSFLTTNLSGWDREARAVDALKWARAGLATLNATAEVEQEPNSTLAHLALEFGCGGPAFNCMTACAAGNQAIGEAFEIIRRGDADVMFAGAAHSMIHLLGMTGFIRLTAMSKRRDEFNTVPRPFDSTRDGFVMGEGAGMLVIEDAEHALRRGATPLAEVAGYGSTADAYRMTDIHPDGKGAVNAMRQACAQAGIDPSARGNDGRPLIHYISAHGTGTKENDSIETHAVKEVFGPLAPEVPFSSVKSSLGHLIQAAGAVELMTCVQAIKTGWVPATINLHHPDPECDLDYVPNQARDLNPRGGVDVCLSNGFGFGGQNDTLCVRRWQD